MPFKRYYRKKRTFRRKAYGKKRLYKKLRISRKFTKPDGISSHKFTIQQDIIYAGNQQYNIIGWHGNQWSAAAIQIVDTPEWPNTQRLYEMYKTKGLKILWEPIDFNNQPGNRTIKNCHIGSFTNGSTAEAVAAAPTIAGVSQRLDYKCYAGNKTVKRYYHVSKGLKNALPSTGQSPSGYCICDPGAVPGAKAVDMGITMFYLELSGGWQAGDYIGKITVTYYANFKDRRVQ